uniref:Codanin-1 C-terminal domain-containing protein n=1 Tax=Anopheles farauti TaxID=69004 RepID=A0A182Q2E2_9DIPT
MEQKSDAHHQRSLEAFASYFISYIHAQTEDSSKYAPPKCDTPRKASTSSNLYQSEPSTVLRKLSITDGSCYPTSGVPGAATPSAAEGRPTNKVSELDTTGTPVHLIAGQHLDHHGGGSSGGDNRTLEVLPTEDDDEPKGTIGHSTPKRFSLQSSSPVNGLPTPNNSQNHAISRCKNVDDASFMTPPRGTRGGGGSSMLLSFTSTPVGGGRGKTTAHHGSSRNGSLEVSYPSPCATSAGLAGDGSGITGRRSKISSPCLGDYIVGQPAKAHKNRRSPFATSNNNASGNDPGGLNSSSTITLNSSMFQDNDFPLLNVTPNKDHTADGGEGQHVKRRVSLATKTSFNESHDSGAASSGRKAGTQRRRIAPTTVSRSVSGRHDFTSSSFRSENNLVAIECQEDATRDPRGMLRHLKEEIRNDFQAEQQARMQRVVRAKQSLHTSFDRVEEVGSTPVVASPSSTNELNQTASADGTETPKQVLLIDFDRVTQKSTIDRLVAVYGLLMDLNLVPNALNELAYLINLVSSERYIAAGPQKLPELTASVVGTDNNAPVAVSHGNILRNPHNCVYFATEVLYHQRMLLALLDSTSLRVVVENDQLGLLQPTLNGFLRDMLAQKMKLETAAINRASADGDLSLANSSITNVFYQQENDTKDHFPSSKEFNAFNKQRDLFYATLRIWETEHLNPAWEFEEKLGSKVRTMLDILHHPINMAHLAKLFSAQLIISFNFDNSASELQMALPNIDLTKLSKLRQRLVAPSIFSTQYLFPGSQTFFRDFIVASENHQIFIEQLKAVLIHELLQMNGSSYELLTISDAESGPSRSEYVVRPETIATMRVLAKFIGFIIARPFQYEGCRSTMVENRQIELRNMLLPPFDVKPVLLKSVAERKLLITVPWLVQYLSMLDVVTLRLRYYEELFRMLHDIYKATAICGFAVHRDLFVIPTSKFIVRSCLDWLFDQSNVPEEYYNSNETTAAISIIDTIAEQAPAVTNRPQLAEGRKPTEKPIVFNALLENVLSAACPFLADFRVSVMPSKVEKTVSRTGRYRHITTRYSGAVTQLQANTTANEASSTIDASMNATTTSAGNNLSKTAPGNVQQRLVEAFLQSQSQSMRRTVELILDRSTSAVIKDFQMLYILPQKKAVNDLIAGAAVDTIEKATRNIQQICDEALDQINYTWDSHVPKMLNKRITESFDALLPMETVAPVRMLCKNITLEKCLQKTNEWRQSYISTTELFCKDVQTEAQSMFHKYQHQRFCNMAKLTSTNGTQTELIIEENCAIMPAGFYVKLQMFVHKVASSPDRVTAGELTDFFAQTHAFLDQPGLTTTPLMNRMLAFMLLQLVLLLIKSRCDLSVPEHFERVIKIWKHTKLARFCSPPPSESEDSPKNASSPSHERSFMYPGQIEQYRRKRMQQDANYVFSHLVSNRFIRMLEENAQPQPYYDVYAEFITSLLEAEMIRKDLLNEQFVTIFNEEWPKTTLDRVSIVINRVLQKSGQSRRPGLNIDDSHSDMFMEMLSDIARDITEL